MFGSWIHQGAELRSDFESAHPFPLIVIDGFLEDAEAYALLREFPDPDSMPKSRDYVFGDKRELSSVAEQGPHSRAFYDAIMGKQFQGFLRELTGKNLFVDPAFHGGGFHQSGDGGFLDTHVDFNVHPHHPDWLRTLNVLLYLNEGWQESYDGRLLVRSSSDGIPRGIEPLFNRGVLMLTNDHTFHGFDRMSLPRGITRKSIATYAYEQVPLGSVKARTTGWAPQNAGPVKHFLATNYNALVKVKGRLFGSATAKNR